MGERTDYWKDLLRTHWQERLFCGLVALLLLGLAVANFIYELRLPYLGMAWDNTSGVIFSVYHGGPAQAAGVRAGDVLLELEGESLRQRDRFRQAWEGLSRFQETAVAVQRGGQTEIFLLVPGYRLPDLEGYVVYYVVGLLFWLGGVTVYFTRQPDATSRVFFGLSMAAFTANFTNVSVSFLRWAGILQRLGMGLAMGFLVHLALVFPTRKQLPHRWRPVVLALIYLPGLALGIANAWLMPQQLAGHYNWLYNLLLITMGGCFVAWLGLLAHTYLTTASPAVRQQLREMLVGGAITLTPFIVVVMVNVLLDIIVHQKFLDRRLIVALLGGFPLSLTYIVLRQESLLDVDALVRRGLVYTTLGILGVGLYLGLLAGLGRLLGITMSSAALRVATGTALLSAFGLLMLRPQVDAVVDRLFYRREH